jgi:hypothetical protein
MFKTMIVAAAVLGAVRIAAPSAFAPAAVASRVQVPSSPSAPTSDVDSEFGTALAMIDHIQKIRISLKGGAARTDR